MGGLSAGKVKPTEHDYAEWERRVDALCVLMGAKGVTVDERRRHIEALPPEAYDKMSYYERWIYAITQVLLQRGVITVDELGRKIEAIRARETQRG